MASQRIHAACPYCSVPMRTAAMECPGCGVEVRGRFHENLFQSLHPDELELLENYLLADFNIKALAKQTGMGYAAIRNRLDRLIDHYARLYKAEEMKKDILWRLESGEYTPEEAARLIARVSSQQESGHV